MNRYTKVIGLTGSMYTKEFEKIKHHKNKIRQLNEETVVKAFKAGDAEICVYFEENDTEILIDAFTDEDTVKKYLGKKFL
ncbi:MAG: hypothetical protein PWQ12_1732 [Clostridiales bacterium]|jgi:hypothetical protein|nr:hypothetical protein [Clostridiales bacterium]